MITFNEFKKMVLLALARGDGTAVPNDFRLRFVRESRDDNGIAIALIIRDDLTPGKKLWQAGVSVTCTKLELANAMDAQKAVDIQVMRAQWALDAQAGNDFKKFCEDNP